MSGWCVMMRQVECETVIKKDMDVRLKKKPWLLRYKYYVVATVLFAVLAVYTLAVILSPAQQRVSAEVLGIAEVVQTDFLEYVEQEGVVQPILALKVNTRVGGYVERIVAEEGTSVQAGDTLLVLSNPELSDELESQEDALHKQLMTYREQEIEMEQKTLLLRKQVLQNRYELDRLSDSYALSEEEYRMGIKSKAELDVARKEYEYKIQAGQLEQESRQHDSVATIVRRSLIKADREQEIRKFERIKARRDGLVVRAPLAGQLSSLQVVPGQQVAAGGEIGEIKVLDRFKVRITPGEYYIDRIVSGLPARATYKGKAYGMAVKRVVPEVKDRTFTVELSFADSVPPSLRIGQTLRVQVELGNPEQTLVIPRGDFYGVTGGQWVYRVVPGERRAVRVPLRLGRQNPRQYEVLEGLQPGDRVITTGYSTFGETEELTWDN